MGNTASTIRFLLNGVPHAVTGVNPQTTLLKYLREQLQLVGTKEGCAEGDCGACTVVVAELVDDARVVLNPINACIRLLPTLDGKAVFTIESLANANTLHPVQQAMVDCHASQCGFCTPGFVMTLFALFKSDAAPTRTRVCEAIAGNLCRCTGYRPILEAGAAMYPLAERAANAAQNASTPLQQWLCTPAARDGSNPSDEILVNALRALRRSETLDYAAADGRFIAPRTIAEFSNCVALNPEAWILGGGTDIGLWINKALQSNATIIYTGEVAALRTVSEDDHAITIGAAVSLDVAFHAMNRMYPELAHVWTRFASWPIRASGTLGGNVANGSPIGDSMPALIALDAKVVLRKGDRQRTISLESLYIDYKKQARETGEWIEAIVLPKRVGQLQIGFYKNSKRNEQDISAVCTAVVVGLDNGVVTHCRIGYGGMAGVPKRALNAERALQGHAWSEPCVREAMRAVANDFTPMNDMRASAEYRLHIAQNHLLRFWFETQGMPAETRVF
jgi:xanthine dehydrogenase small subunit